MHVWCGDTCTNHIMALMHTNVLQETDSDSSRCGSLYSTFIFNLPHRYIIAEKLPQINYLTLIDRYVILCYLILFIVVMVQYLAALNVFDGLWADAAGCE